MRRFVSIWLPHWPIERRLCQIRRTMASAKWRSEVPQNDKTEQPFVLTASAQGGIRVMALNGAAAAAGLKKGQLLTDARAIFPAVSVEDYDPEGDLNDLEKLARYCIRYSPWVNIDPPDGLLMEISGCAHLFGGEEAMLQQIKGQMAQMKLTSHVTVASTIGAAWAVNHYGSKSFNIIRAGEERQVLRALPLTSLRLEEAILQRLHKVGFKTIGQVMEKPRSPLRNRYGALLLHRLEQALGNAPEALSPLMPPPEYQRQRTLQEPILLLDQIRQVLAQLGRGLSADLQEDHKGARRLIFSLFRVDGEISTITLRTGHPCFETDHILRLFSEKLDQLQDEMNVGYGFDHLTLSAQETEVLEDDQKDLENNFSTSDRRELDRLLDRFVGRLGAENIVRFHLSESHIPEKSQRMISVHQPTEDNWRDYLKRLQGGHYLGRPIILLKAPELITAMAEVPDGPPVGFEWRRIKHRVTRADGPERLSPEWWQAEAADRAQRDAENMIKTRDYFRVEDEEGLRFWLFRAGLYERGEAPRWFMHGLFA